MTRKSTVVLEDWPQPCAGGCGRLLRPSHTKPSQYPDHKTVVSVLVTDPWCDHCRRAVMGRAQYSRKHHGHAPPLTPEQEKARLEAMRRDLDAMIRSRRARGIPPEGILMEGETAEFHYRQRPLPGTEDM